MIKTIKARLEKEGRLVEDASSDSDFSFLSSPTAILNTATESRITKLEDVKKSWKEASTKSKGKEVMTEEVEERLMKEQREREERTRRRKEEEMAELRKIQERKAAMLFREQQIQLYAKQLDDLIARFPAASQLQEDEALALQLQEQFNKEEE
ncbi:hypothetical protein L1987_01614 [Smallanthus sonchifolius]|uniref:Uncharacterized protein n=1 Tax=Smallanthus sonchifolius TaxID=185202 RepID=A0ACB9K5J7_9ASTR|nr:hypothetical protein L1987_01614 [Smallanthus sonchifolius]